MLESLKEMTNKLINKLFKKLSENKELGESKMKGVGQVPKLKRYSITSFFKWY